MRTRTEKARPLRPSVYLKNYTRRVLSYYPACPDLSQPRSGVASPGEPALLGWLEHFRLTGVRPE